MRIKEAIVVEGRDDTAAVSRALDADTIETHGFGIAESTWELLDKAYAERGLIIFTDPDHAGEEIRARLTERYPKAGHAFLSRDDAEKSGDIQKIVRDDAGTFHGALWQGRALLRL